MLGGSAYLLDTNVVLHATRQNSPISRVIDTQFGLSASRFRPAICEVSIAELLAFARSTKWGDKRKARLDEQIERCLVIPISYPGVHERWANMSSALQANGITIGQNDIWIAAAASVVGLTVLSTDADFRHLVRLGLLEATVLNATTGLIAL